MKSLRIMGTIALMCSNMLVANEMETHNDVTLASEILSLPELLSHVEDAVQLVIDADYETCQLAYHELKENLRIVYAINCLHRSEAAIILQVLDECYANLVDAIDRDPAKATILEQSLSLFASGRNYDHETLAVQSLQDWTDTTTPNKLKSAIETTDADLIYIQENVQWNVQKDVARSPSLILYNTSSFQNSGPKILIIRHKETVKLEHEKDDNGKSRTKVDVEFEYENKKGYRASAQAWAEKKEGNGKSTTESGAEVQVGRDF